MLDLTLAIAHHILVFGLVAMLAVEGVMLRSSAIDVKALARIDGRYGLVATLVILIGVGRIIWGGKGWAFYQENPFFWLKMGAFVGIALLSFAPTMTFLRWARAKKADATFQPPEGEIGRARKAVGLQALLVLVVVASAAAMARYPF